MSENAEMDCEDPAETKRAYKCNYQLFDNLNVVYNSSTSMIIFWNKYQLFLYENFNFDDATIIFTPEFLVHQILISNNYLLCLDCNGNIHVTSLKFKNCAQKRLKTNFQPRQENIVAWVQRNEHVLSLKLEDETYSLCLNKMVTELSKVKQIQIRYDDDTWPLPKTTQQKCLITACKVPENDENVKKLFNTLNLLDYDIVIITFDRMDTFACLFNPNTFENELKLVKLYSSPLEIHTIQILELEDLNILFALTSGTVMKLPLVKSTPPPVAIHLNTAIYKFVASKDIFMYTDGISMWKTEDSFTSIKFTQLFVRQVKDFVKCGDQLICTTYSNLFYLLPVDNENIYLEANYSEFCPVEKLSNNTEYLFKVFEEANNNIEVVDKVYEEGNYITAMALSNRPDLMETVVQTEVVVYDYYEDVIKENQGIMLMEDLKEYFRVNSIYLLVKITTLQMEALVNELMKQLFNASKFHISLYSDDKLVKTNSINIPESLKKINLLIPIDSMTTNMANIKLVVEIVLHIPGASVNEPAWLTFYHIESHINPEYFIKTDLISNKNVTSKDPEEPIEELILKLTLDETESLFKFSSLPSLKGNPSSLSLYVKLPPNYRDIFQNRELLNRHYNSIKADYLFKQLSSEEFLQSKNYLTFEIGRLKVEVEIVSDELQHVSSALLRVACECVETAQKMRNFFADLIYDNFDSPHPSTKFVDHILYSATENMQKALIESGDVGNAKNLYVLTKQFQKNVIGSLPL
ncbi:hypothetical protein MSG28_013753 [Choristoneura fumiferana]|uniref:Uncharacterized protein n=1 Tax=Choristoneura fumiferana TaxID=7141 RepID=A0ACC0K9B0_CHOFU|nr:hypothetical protein MSG28_013753 [Choristoneura fumiferana]